MRDFLKSVQEEMLAIIQTFCTSTRTSLVLGSEGPSSQESLQSMPGSSTSFPFSQELSLAQPTEEDEMEEAESQAKSELFR